MSQLSLVFFTVLAQSAVGMFIALGLVELLFKPDRKIMTRSFIAVLVMLGIGATASITHLGQPLRMLNVAFGLAHGSALSLEIVALSLFGGSAAVYTGMRLFDVAPKLQKPLLPIAMVLGIVFILAIANVYTLATVPTWSTGFTPFQFLMTAAVVGPIAATCVLAVQMPINEDVQQSSQKLLTNIAGLFTVVALVGYTAYLVWLGQLNLTSNPFDVVNNALVIISSRVGLLVAGLLLWFAMRSSTQRNSLLIVSFVLIICSEFAGRIFFYDVYIRASSGM
ncbi:DmsC/YnfH family molybdoenzyme membrane anchor subunit [Vibrio sp. FNV 38]|nr:DmsC/YnfH family molybdoenzyme membrane anchor subunit [Vibrio sp. FNV 38]